MSIRFALSALMLALLISPGQAEGPPMAGSVVAAPLNASIDFPGGSGEKIAIDQAARKIALNPTKHKDRGWACWWYVKVTGIIPGETITLDVGDAPWATPDRAAFSSDNLTWKQTAPGKRAGKRITYTQKVDAKEAWFAWGPPFVPDDAQKLVDWAAKTCSHAKAFELCKTVNGRSVPALKIEQPGASEKDRYGIVFVARQHAWESGGSWVCRGVTEWLVSDDPQAESLRKQATIYVVPIMDIDNAAIGAGGKEEVPQDHNRDWSEKPHWTSVAAVQAKILEMHKGGNFDMFVDLHNPDAAPKNPFFYFAPKEIMGEKGIRNIARFVDLAKQEMTAPLAFKGETRISGANYDKNWLRMSKNWVSKHTAGHVLAFTLETAWNTPESTQEGYSSVGRKLGKTIARYFDTAPRKPE